jgi:hypothetical protein
MTNLSRHKNVLRKLVTSLLIREIQVGRMSKLDWLIGLIKHVIWGRFLVLPIPAVTFNLQNFEFSRR